MFDFLVDHHKVMKVETAGDCYIVAGGIMETDDEGFYQVGVAAVNKMGLVQMFRSEFHQVAMGRLHTHWVYWLRFNLMQQHVLKVILE